jgi:hypothetical protein
MERSKFDVSELEFTHIRYRRPDAGEKAERESEILRQIQMSYANVGDLSHVDPESAVNDLNNVTVDTYEYRSPFEYESVRFEKRLRRSIKLVKGEVEPEPRRSS